MVPIGRFDDTSAPQMSISGTLKRNQAIRLGPVTVEIVGGIVVINCRGASLRLARGRRSTAWLCITDGSEYPELIPGCEGAAGMDADPDGDGSPRPLVTLGPGGDFVDHIYPDDLMGGASHAGREARAVTGGEGSHAGAGKTA